MIVFGRTYQISLSFERAIETVRSGDDTVRGAAFKFQVKRSSLSGRLFGKVAVAARTGPPTVLAAAEESATEDVLNYAGSHYLVTGVTR